MANKPSSHSTFASMYKNKLQEYTQKQCLPFPAYRTANEGFQHAPKFRTTVYVDGVEYTSKSTFGRLREAEQDAAKLAYECILSNVQQTGFKPMLDEESRSSKSILHELTLKNHGEIPMYKTILGEGEGNLPVYVSRVTVNDKTFTGAGAKSKREAQQFAARTALESLLGTDCRDVLNHKRKQCGAPIDVSPSELNQKKVKTMGSQELCAGPGDGSQVKRMLIPSAPYSSSPVNKPVFRRQPDARRVRIGLGNTAQGGSFMNRKKPQHGRLP
ncbi:double-stranded RNA-binding protein 4-like isoform X2 [Silene latifolia]|uniref:double-stranded RNA-binding protein 4-like isoform X2 n=1 Tax=Silene latifolia TaxID=37657 RepID=UPI003D77759C